MKLANRLLSIYFNRGAIITYPYRFYQLLADNLPITQMRHYPPADSTLLRRRMKLSNRLSSIYFTRGAWGCIARGSEREREREREGERESQTE